MARCGIIKMILFYKIKRAGGDFFEGNSPAPDFDKHVRRMVYGKAVFGRAFQLIEDLKLETVYMPRDPQEIMIKTVDINRPGLQLCGFYDYFDSNRIQLFGLGEFAYMEKYTPRSGSSFWNSSFPKRCRRSSSAATWTSPRRW